MENKIYLLLLILVPIFSCNETKKEKPINSNDCTLYSCPMHPDKTSATPAQCSECGMEMKKDEKKKSDSTKISGNDKK
jgi:hypothetical protein